MQIISALRAAGHRVTFSMPLDNYIARQNLERVLPQLTPEDIWACEHILEPDVVLNRFQPQISITCNINTFRAVGRYARDIVHIVDLNGPLHLEALLLENDFEEATYNGKLMEERSRAMVEQLRYADYVLTVSEWQKYYWTAYCSLAGFSFDDARPLVCPPSFDAPFLPRNLTPKLSVVYSGGFYPWQDPERSLRASAKILEGIEGAKLHIFGAPHTGFPNEKAAYSLIAELKRFSCVEYHGYRPIEDLFATFAGSWCALEVMERNLERELAIPGRTVLFLSTGTPLIYNDYSTGSELIDRYKAGWTIDEPSETNLRPIYEELVERGPEYVQTLSDNARRLSEAEFGLYAAMEPLVALCNGDLRKRNNTAYKTKTVSILTSKNGVAKGPRVLAVSPDTGALRDLRITNPLRALQRQGLISGFHLTDERFHSLRPDLTAYDAVIIQRKVPEYVYQVFENLAVPFIQDIDDNLLARASFRAGEELELGLLSGLRNCVAVTAPNPRLIRMLERYSGLVLASKSFVTPNALPFPDQFAGRVAASPSQILWIQSDIAGLSASREAIVTAVEEFSRTHNLPVLLIGKNVLNRPRFTHQVVLGEIDFISNLQMLEFMPTSIGVAPLETDADGQTLDFVAGKSDLKMLLFGGYGHTGVYSDATPYTDSGLQKFLTVTSNSREAWEEALEERYRHGWKTIGDVSALIREERHIERVARESWWPAIQAAMLNSPVRATDLYAAHRATAMLDLAPVRTIGYMAGNGDVLAQAMRHKDLTALKEYATVGILEQHRAVLSAHGHHELLKRLDQENARGLREGAVKLKRLHDTLVHYRNINSEKDAEIEKLRKHADSLQNIIGGIITSKSWRVTAPLRNFAQRFRS